MNSKTALRILSLGLIAMLCDCNKKPPVEEPAEATVDVDAVPAVKPEPSTYVYGTPYDTANNPVYRDARDAANEAAYTGKRLAYEGVWINKEILKVYQETNSPALAAENGVVSEISLSRDSVSVTFFARWSRSGPIKFTAKDRIVAECEFEFGGIIQLNDSEMVFQRFGDPDFHYLVRISDSSIIDPYHNIVDRLVLKPPLLGEYQGDSGRSLKFGLDRIEGFKECPKWAVSLDYMDPGRSFSLSEEVNNFGYDVLQCFQNDDPDPEMIGYELQADSLILFRLHHAWQFIDTLARFARKPVVTGIPGTAIGIGITKMPDTDTDPVCRAILEFVKGRGLIDAYVPPPRELLSKAKGLAPAKQAFLARGLIRWVFSFEEPMGSGEFYEQIEEKDKNAARLLEEAELQKRFRDISNFYLEAFAVVKTSLDKESYAMITERIAKWHHPECMDEPVNSKLKEKDFIQCNGEIMFYPMALIVETMKLLGPTGKRDLERFYRVWYGKR